MAGGPEFQAFLEQQLGQQGGFGAGRFMPGFQGQQGGQPGGFPGQPAGLMPWDYQIPQAPQTITPPVGQFSAPPLAAPAPGPIAGTPAPGTQPWQPPHDPGR